MQIRLKSNRNKNIQQSLVETDFTSIRVKGKLHFLLPF